MKKISILVISRNLDNLVQLFDSLKHQGTLDFDIHVSWNGESNIIHELQRYPFNIIVHVIKPYHFASNNNELSELTDSEYLLFLNDDIILDRDVLPRVLEPFKNPKIGMVSINLRFRNEMIQHAGVFFRNNGTHYHRYKNALHYTDPRVQVTELVPAITGAFIIIKRKDFLAVRFDESFLVAGEDLAFSLNFRRKFDKSILYCGDITAIHAENETRKITDQRFTPDQDLARIRDYYFDISNSIADFENILQLSIVTDEKKEPLSQMAKEISKCFKRSATNSETEDPHIHYYIDYQCFKSRPSDGIVVACFLHCHSESLDTNYLEIANKVDHCVSVSSTTTKMLIDGGIPKGKITTIPIGADSHYRPILTLGVVGEVDSDNVNDVDLVKQLNSDEELMQHVQIVSPEPDWGVKVWPFDDLADFYRSIDYLLVSSKIDRGSLSYMESLACGTMSIAPPIGVVPDFPHIEYETGNIESLKAVIVQVLERYKISKEPLVGKIQTLNWDNWRIQHRKLFQSLLLE